MHDKLGRLIGCLLFAVIAAACAWWLSHQYFPHHKDDLAVYKLIETSQPCSRFSVSLPKGKAFCLLVVGPRGTLEGSQVTLEDSTGTSLTSSIIEKDLIPTNWLDDYGVQGMLISNDGSMTNAGFAGKLNTTRPLTVTLLNRSEGQVRVALWLGYLRKAGALQEIPRIRLVGMVGEPVK